MPGDTWVISPSHRVCVYNWSYVYNFNQIKKVYYSICFCNSDCKYIFFCVCVCHCKANWSSPFEVLSSFLTQVIESYLGIWGDGSAAKCVLHKHKDLGLDFQHSHKKPRMVVPAQKGRVRDLCDFLVQPVGELQVQWETMSRRIKWRVIEQNIWFQLLAYMFTCIGVSTLHTFTNMCIYRTMYNKQTLLGFMCCESVFPVKPYDSHVYNFILLIFFETGSQVVFLVLPIQVLGL